MGVLVLDPTKISQLKEYANQHRYNWAIVKKCIDEQCALPGYGANFHIDLPIGFHVAYTIEEHPGGWFSHLSVSIDKLGKLPNVVAVQQLIEAFGFTRELGDCIIFLSPNQDPPVINIVEPLPDATPMDSHIVPTQN